MLLKNKKCSNCAAYYDPTLNECPECHKENELRSQRGVFDNIFHFSPTAQIGIFLIGFAYVGMLITELIMGVLFTTVADKTLRSTLVILFAYLAMLGGIAAIAFSTRRKTFIQSFKRPLDYAFGAGYLVAAITTGMIVSLIVGFFHEPGTNENQSMAITIVENYPIIAFFILVLIGPICEEMAYRVGLFSFLRRINVVLAFIVTTIIFALIHFDPTADNIVEELWALPSYIVPGIVLTFAYYHRGPACSMTAHILYNLISYLMILIAK